MLPYVVAVVVVAFARASLPDDAFPETLVLEGSGLTGADNRTVTTVAGDLNGALTTMSFHRYVSVRCSFNVVFLRPVHSERVTKRPREQREVTSSENVRKTKRYLLFRGKSVIRHGPSVPHRVFRLDENRTRSKRVVQFVTFE